MIYNKYDNTKVKELDNDNYKINKKSIKINNNNKKPGIVVFYSLYCGYCNMIVPEILKLAEKKNINVYAIHSLNEKNNKIFEFLEIRGVPEIRFVKESGLISKSFIGNRTMKELYEFIKKNQMKKIKNEIKPIKSIKTKKVKNIKKNIKK